MPPIKILLADDQPLFREGLRILLALQPDFEVVGEASNGAEALQLAAALAPDVVVMDVAMPVLDGLAATRRLRQTAPHCRVVILTTFGEADIAAQSARAGAAACLLKDVPIAEVVAAIRQAAAAGRDRHGRECDSTT
ncbi:MAG: response regulator transcription factor [Anaerolineae bacterium]